MKIIKKIGIVLLGIILLVVIISFFLPRKVHVERSLEMKATPEAAFALVNNLKAWEEWSPWHDIDTNMVLTYSEVAEGPNSFYGWTSDNKNVGNGKLIILETKEFELIKTQLNFEDMDPSYADFIFEKTAEGVKVTWTMDSDMGYNPIGRFFGLMMDKMIGPDYEKGLAKMKEVAERVPEHVTIAGFEFEERMMDKMSVMGIREKLKVTEISSDKFGQWFAAIGKSISKAKVTMAGAPMSIYYSFDNVNTDIEAAIPIAGEGKDDGNVKYHEIPASKALVVKYYGNYGGVEPVYNEAFAYISKQGMKTSGPPMEVYVTDPGTEKDTTKWLTEIVFPIQ